MADKKSNFQKYIVYGIGILMILTFLQTCGTKGKIERIENQIEELSTKHVQDNENLNLLIKELPTAKDIKIEGLKVEKRMIQATNRKMLDVNRQNEIEKEISKLKKLK